MPKAINRNQNVLNTTIEYYEYLCYNWFRRMQDLQTATRATFIEARLLLAEGDASWRPWTWA